jgi:lysophospholipase L1-like esterase
MSDFLVRETANLFDPATGAWVGVLDHNGNEQVVPSAAGLAARPEAMAPFVSSVSGYRVRNTPVRCATFGDSTSNVGLGNTDNAIFDAPFPASGPALVSYELSKWSVYQFYPQAKMVANGGISGETTTQMLARDNAAASATRKAIADVINLAPDVVFLRCGSINSITGITSGNYSSVVATTYAEHIRILNRFRAAGIPTVDIGILGYSGSVAANPDLVRQALVELNNMYAAYYAALNSRTAVWMHPGLCDSAGFLNPLASNDGIHLNMYGAQWLGALEAKALTTLFGPSAGPRFPGANLLLNPLFSATGSVAYGVAPTGYSASATNATLANGKLEEIDGEVFWTVEVTPTTTAPSVTLLVPFNVTTFGIAANDVLGYEIAVFASNLAGTGAPPAITGYYVRNDIYKSGAGRFVPCETLTAFGGFPGPYKAHVSFAYRCQEASAALTSSSSAPVLFSTGSLTPFKIGISCPRLVKLGLPAVTN